jgi:hypothetical protein
MMKYPKSFKLGKHPHLIVQTPALPHFGTFNPATRIISIRKRQANKSNTFWHEVTHAILYDMGDPLWKNESFVTKFSGRLDELIKTAKFDK